jgi:hypothetical protein
MIYSVDVQTGTDPFSMADYIYCPELGYVCDGTLGCIDCPYTDQ